LLRGLSRRDVLVLIVLWTAAAALLCGLLVWFLVLRPGSPVEPGQIASTPGPAPTYTVEFVQVTARSLYPAAEALARAWEPDAYLVGANAVWSATALNLIGNPTDWSFRFYSPARQRLYLVGVSSDGQALGAPHFQKESSPPPAINPEAWVIDSPEALARWLDHGGGQLLGGKPGMDVTMQLGLERAAGRPIWIITGFGAGVEAPLALKVDASSGQVSPYQP